MAGNWRFRRYGRSVQMVVDSAEDLRRVGDLDEAHWVATGAPVSGLSCDETFLKLVDGDGNGRILCEEITGAIRWLLETLGDHSGIASGSRVLRLDAVNADTPDGQAIVESAGKMLARLARGEDGEITLEEVRRFKAREEATPVSEAGVVLPAAAGDDAVRGFIADVIATVGGAEHPSGKPGVGEAQLEAFLREAAAHLEWRARGELADGQEATEVMPLGAATDEAFAALQDVRGKLDQYFAQCEAVAFDERVASRMGLTEQELAELDFDDPAVIDRAMAESPLARARADGVLSFTDPVNAYYAPALERLREKVLRPVLGKPPDQLAHAQWLEVKGFFAAHQQWRASQAGQAVEPLGAARLRAYLEGPEVEAVRTLIAESSRTAFVLDNIRLVEKLILYQSHLKALANNFVSFPDLYDNQRRAMFEMGTLIMDGRHFNLAVRADDRAAHSRVAANSNMFVMYAEVLARDGATLYEVAVPVTSGGKGNLAAGKRGVFHDVRGAEHDARVVQIIENPISVGEALVSPFKRLGQLVTGKIESLTAQAEKKLDTATTAALRQAEAPPAASRAGGLAAGGLLMGGGVAIAALGSAIAYISKTLTQLHWWEILIGVGSAVLAVILPTSVVAMLKLRRRDLSAILEGSGWAVNARMRLTWKQGRFFARRPRYPRGARGTRHVPRWAWALLVVVLLAVAGSLIGWALHKGGSGKPAGEPATRSAPKSP